MSKELLLSPEEFLKSGIHIGTKYRSNGMNRFIYSNKKDGLKVLSIEDISERVKLAVNILKDYDTDKIVVVGRRIYATKPIQVFASIFGFKVKTGRFIPGSFTNTTIKDFIEPHLVFVAEPDLDYQAVKEAKEIKVPTIALCTTQNRTEYIDFILPCNNRGRKSLATMYWLLARELMLVKGMIKSRIDFKKKVEDFEYKQGREDRQRPQRNSNPRRGGGRGGSGGGFRGRRSPSQGDRPFQPRIPGRGFGRSRA